MHLLVMEEWYIVRWGLGGKKTLFADGGFLDRLKNEEGAAKPVSLDKEM